MRFLGKLFLETEEWAGAGSSLMLHQGEMCLTSVVAFCDAVTALVDKGQATDIV